MCRTSCRGFAQGARDRSPLYTAEFTYSSGVRFAQTHPLPGRPALHRRRYSVTGEKGIALGNPPRQGPVIAHRGPACVTGTRGRRPGPPSREGIACLTGVLGGG